MKPGTVQGFLQVLLSVLIRHSYQYLSTVEEGTIRKRGHPAMKEVHGKR
jgi:hypothetical protein